ELLKNCPELRQIESEWERVWFNSDAGVEMIPPPKKAPKQPGCCPPGVWLLPPPPALVEPLGVEPMDRLLSLVEPCRPKLFLHVEDEGNGEEQEEPPCDDVGALLRKLLTVLGVGGCADVDASSPQAPRVDCQLEIGGF